MSVAIDLAECPGCGDVAEYARRAGLLDAWLHCDACGAPVRVTSRSRGKAATSGLQDDERAWRLALYRTLRDTGCIARYRAWRDRQLTPKAHAPTAALRRGAEPARGPGFIPEWLRAPDAETPPMQSEQLAADSRAQADRRRGKVLDDALLELARNPDVAVSVAVLEYLVTHCGFARTRVRSPAEVIGEAFASARAVAAWRAAGDLACMCLAHGQPLLRDAVNAWAGATPWSASRAQHRSAQPRD